MEPSPHGPEKRRRDLRGRLARVTYPARQALGEFVFTLPCRFVGHRWVEASRGVRRKRQGKRLRFRCARCHLHAGFTS